MYERNCHLKWGSGFSHPSLIKGRIALILTNFAHFAFENVSCVKRQSGSSHHHLSEVCVFPARQGAIFPQLFHKYEAEFKVYGAGRHCGFPLDAKLKGSFRKASDICARALCAMSSFPNCRISSK